MIQRLILSLTLVLTSYSALMITLTQEQVGLLLRGQTMLLLDSITSTSSGGDSSLLTSPIFGDGGYLTGVLRDKFEDVCPEGWQDYDREWGTYRGCA